MFSSQKKRKIGCGSHAFSSALGYFEYVGRQHVSPGLQLNSNTNETERKRALANLRLPSGAVNRDLPNINHNKK